MPPHPSLDAAISRRALLRLGGAAGALAFLAACEATDVAPTPGATAVPSAAGPSPAGPAASPSPGRPQGAFRMASPIGLIDVGEDLDYPSLDRFTAETGIVVDYQEVIENEEEFVALDLGDAIEAGFSSGWDVCILTDAMAQRLAAMGWLEPIDPDLTDFPANLEDRYRDRTWDPGNRIAAPWSSGMTGLGYDRAVTGPLADLDVLFAATYAGRVAYLDEMRDTTGLAALRLGSDPATLTRQEYDAALATIRQAFDDGIVRPIRRDSVEDMLRGSTVVAVAWSGDVESLLVPEQRPGQDFRWTLPSQGGMLWSENMVIPKGAQNQRQAGVFIDWYYAPENAARIAASVRFVCPVRGARDAMATIDPDLVDDPTIFPTAAMEARLHAFRALEPVEAAAWQAGFDRAVRS